MIWSKATLRTETVPQLKLLETESQLLHTLVNLTEDNNTWKLCFGIVRDARVEEEYPCQTSVSLFSVLLGHSIYILMSPPALVGTSLCVSVMIIFVVVHCSSLGLPWWGGRGGAG